LPSTANGINANGEVVGYSDSTAVEWTPGATTPTALGPPGTVSDAYAVNASGLVVGASYTQDASRNVVTHAMRWDAAATPPTDLGTLSGITSTVAWGINTSGQVVGAAGTTPNGDTFGHAVLWNAGATTPTDLGDLLPTNSGWRLGTANAINDAEQIVGVGRINGAQHGFRLTCS
jgi:probable HAF family extracellular repeat protein